MLSTALTGYFFGPHIQLFCWILKPLSSKNTKVEDVLPLDIMQMKHVYMTHTWLVMIIGGYSELSHKQGQYHLALFSG